MKFLILENDIEHQGLPDMLQDVLDINKDVPYEVWWWFGQDVSQHPKEAFQRFASISEDTFLVSYPSFVGHGNSFEGKLHLFDKLMQAGIKIRIGLLYYPHFYWFLVKWLHDTGSYIDSQSKKDKEIETLKKCLLFHEIYAIPYKKADYEEIPIMQCRERITWETLEPNYFRAKSYVYVNGIKRKSLGLWVDIDNPEKTQLNFERKNDDNSYSFEQVLLSLVSKTK